MQISIIIPIYKVEKYIERCINSVIIQTFTDYEVVLVDDKSPDNALAIAESLLKENKIAFQSIKHETNQGLSEARNSGMKIAKGKYIMFLDSDDELSHNAVLTQFHEAIEKEKVDFITADHYVIRSEGNIRNKKNETRGRILQGAEILENFLYSNLTISAWNKLINRKFLFDNHLFFQKGLIHEDDLWFFQLAIVAKNCYCFPDYTYNYHRDNPHSIIKNADDKTYKDRIYILGKQLEIAKEKQLLTSKTADAFAYNFKRISRFILHPDVLKDKKIWMEYYTKLRRAYQENELWQHKKIFRFSAHIAYFIEKETRRNWLNNGNRFYRKILNNLQHYNGV